MKKIAALLAVVMCLCALAAPVSAVASKGSYGKVPMYDGKITVDGKIDDIYKKGLAVDVAGDYSDKYASDTTAKAYFLHDGKNIYMALEVKSGYTISDKYDASIASAPHKGTGAEVYFDFADKGVKGTHAKYTCWHDGTLNVAVNAKKEEAELKTSIDVAKKTYILELKVALQDGATTGKNIGWYVMVNDNKDVTKPNQDYIAVPTQLNGVVGANDASQWFSLALDSAKVALDTTAATTKAPAAKPTSPATFDAGIVLAVVAAAAGAGVIVSKKKH